MKRAEYYGEYLSSSRVLGSHKILRNDPLKGLAPTAHCRDVDPYRLVGVGKLVSENLYKKKIVGFIKYTIK